MLPLSVLRQYNNDYLTKEDYIVGQQLVKGGLNQVPYNEVFIRVGGLGRIVNGKDCATAEEYNEFGGRSLDRGLGLPAALFVRSASYGHLIALLRTRARLFHYFGKKHIHGIPLVLITPEEGIRVLTESLQRQLLCTAARKLNPFQNLTIAHKTRFCSQGKAEIQQKQEELLEIEVDETLTSRDCASLAGGFGVTDNSFAAVLKEASKISLDEEFNCNCLILQVV